MKVITYLSLVLACLLCAFDAQAQEPQWLKDARAKESGSLKTSSIRSTDGFFTARVPGKVTSDIVGKDGGYLIMIDIAAQAPATCEVIVDGFDLGSLLRSTAEITLKELESAQGKIEQKAVERTDAGVMGSSPYIATDWLYRVNDGKGPKLGKLKQIAVLKGGHGLYCAHVDLGYTKTFLEVARTVAESLQFSKPGTDTYYSEVSTIAIAGSKMGVEWARMERDPDGDTKIVITTSMVVRVTADTLRAQDAVHVQWVHPNGALINGAHVVSADGEVDTDLKLTATDDGKWSVKGDFKGKKLDQVISGDSQPASWLETANARRQAFAQKDIAGVTLTAPVWLTADPTRFIDSQMTLLAVLDGQRISARESLAGIKAEDVLDRATGYPITSTMEVGPLSLQVERVYVQGSF